MAVKTHSSLKTSSRIINVSNTFNPALPPTVIEYLVVAGGGSGATWSSTDVKGAGGGAGGLLTGNANISFTTYTVVVGTGGAGQNTGSGNYGSNSSFVGTGVNLVSYGGGRGGWFGDSGNGGSGGGASGSSYVPGGPASQPVGDGVYPGSPFVSAPRQGYPGANGPGSLGGTAVQGGGGGGAGGAGVYGGAGGPGYTSSISGSSVTYASGGAGGSGNNYPPGSKTAVIGGGGAGASATATPAAFYSQGGGDGAVIIRYPNTYPAAFATTGSVTITNTGGYRVYNFTGSGTISFI